MITNYPNNVQCSRRLRVRALTILEMLVSVALLSVIILGLTAMFVQTTKAFKSGIKQSSMTDSGRTVIDMIAADLSQLSNPGFTNVPNPYTGSAPGPFPPTLFWQWAPSQNMIQTINDGATTLTRTNELQVIYALLQSNATWTGVGYYVSNWFTNSDGTPYPGVGTLYRYVVQTTAPLQVTNLLCYDFTNFVGLTNFHRIADGVVDLKITAFDHDGNENYYQRMSPDDPIQYPYVGTNIPYYTNFLPHSIDIEVGVLEPEAFEHARSLFQAGAIQAAGLFLTNSAGQVQVFRQHILIPAAP